MKKAIAILDQHIVLREIVAEIRENEDHAKQKLEFLDKQKKDIQNTLEAKNSELKGNVTAYLKEINLLPQDFVDCENSHIHLNEEMGVLLLCDSKSHPKSIFEFFRNLGIDH